MILRKPYAFFIKQFKTIHFILSIMISFLIYRTTIIIAFFSEYLSSSTLTIDPTSHDKLFNFYIFAIPVLVILVSMLVLWVLFLKEKPLLFYVINIAIYLGIIVILSHTSSIVNDMMQQVVHPRTIRLARDLLLMSVAGQIFSIIKTFVYATGFDIKKFNFGQDLAELEIEESDDEEFEFEISVDTNKAHRDIRRRARFSRYVYVENKFLINIGLLLFTSITFLIIYFNQNIYNKTYNEGVAFNTSDFTIQINKSYVTKKNPQGQEISRNNMSFIIVETSIKKHGVKKIKLDIARAQLIANQKAYYHKFGFHELVSDIGYNYDNSDIMPDFKRYLLIYEVPDEYIKKGNIQFKFLDTFGYSRGRWNPKYVRINLRPRKLDTIVKASNYNLGDEVSFKKSILGNTTIKINSFNIAREYKLDYNFCVNTKECYPSYEYLKPDIYNVVDKTLMHINGLIDWDNSLGISPIADVYRFFDKFGKIIYEKDGKIREHVLDLREIKSQKIKKVNNYYIEVSRELESADSIFIKFNVRDMEYTYKLR